MTPIATARWLAVLVLLPLVGVQAQPLDDEFIFFVDGKNVLLPETDFTAVADPLPASDGDRAAQFTYSDFTPVRFAGWERTTGTDATEYTGDEYGDSDYKLYVDILSGTDNQNKSISLTFFDSTNDPAGSRDDFINGTASGDLEFRLVWTIPQEVHDDAEGWITYEIPLPPSTIAALDSAKVGKKSDGSDLDVEFDELAANWSYTGGWNNGGSFGYGEPEGFTPASTDPLFKEFEWSALHSMAVFFDTDQGGETIWLDNVYIAEAPIDLSVAQDPPAAMGNIMAAAEGDVNVISWTPSAEFGGYAVYASLDPITDVNADGVLQLETVAFDAEDFEVEHQYEVPHPSFGKEAFYYAVTSLSQFGVENTDVSASTTSVINPNFPQQAYIIQLTDDEANTIFQNINNDVLSTEGFPEGFAAFELDMDHSQLTEGAAPAPEDSDVSGSFRMAYSNFNELYIYVEVTDDVVEFIGADTKNPGAGNWEYDSFEIGWGNYDVEDVPGGSILAGSPYVDPGEGQYADYQFRVSGLHDAGDNVVGTTTFTGRNGRDGFEIGATLVEETDTGWRALSVIPLNQIQYEGDAVVEVPDADEIRFMPMELALNDADGSAREHQITWGLKNNHTNQWWNSPNQWPTVAMAGRDTVMPVDNEDEGADAAFAFGLGANYPNPFTQSTKIAYTLDQDVDVKLEVYDVLGRRVASLVDKAQPAGRHAVEFDATGLANGAYIYRLRAGEKTAVRQMMLLQ